MNTVRSVTQDLLWVGASDRRLARFENLYPVPQGMAYNAYLLLDDKTVLLDTADAGVAPAFFENLAAALGDRPLDVLVVQHMEPDHCACVAEVVRRWPAVELVCSMQAKNMLGQFFGPQVQVQARTVKEGETLCTGRHTLQFFMAPMVHWPEVMVTFDTTEGTLFSADAFGSFGAINGNLFADEGEPAAAQMAEYRRYYTNIVGKYGPQVQALLKKAAGLDVRRICPLHGRIWREDFSLLLEKYNLWSSYAPEEKGVLLAFGSVYGHTEAAMDLLAHLLSQRGVKNVALYDASSTHVSVLVAEAFRLSHWVLAAPTYNAGLFPPVEAFLREAKAHNLQNRTVALVENGTWAPLSAKLMDAELDGMKNMTRLEPTVTVRSAAGQAQVDALAALADALAADLQA